MAIEFKSVAAALSCREFAEAELQIGRNGRSKCPNRDDCNSQHGYNLAFTPDGRSYCFRCGRVFDVVQLAAHTWGVSQREAAETLNEEYHLCLDHQTTPEDRERWQRRVDQRDAERAEREAAVAEAEEKLASARAAAEADSENAELQRQVRNAETWLSFKRMEMSLAAARGC